MVIICIKFQLLKPLNSPAKVAPREAIAVATWGLALIAFACRFFVGNVERYTARYQLYGAVLACLSVREHWSSHWAGSVEHSTLLY
jgi:hypothetical protein